MVGELLQPTLIPLGQGLMVGLVVGFAARKLNKVIAALLGVAIIALNILWFMRMLEFEPGLKVLNQLADAFVRLIPIPLGGLKQELEPLMQVSTRLPFIGGLLLGLIVGFKLA